MMTSPSSPLGARRNSLETLVAVEGHRWAIEDSFETAKNEFGSITMRADPAWLASPRVDGDAAFAMMAVIRHHANPPQPKKTQRRTTQKQNHRRLVIDTMSIQEVRRIASGSLGKRIQPAHTSHGHLAQSHQAIARRAHLKQNGNCNC